CGQVMAVREPTPLAREVAGRLEGLLEEAGSAARRILKWAAEGDRNGFLGAIERGRKAVEALFADFRHLQEEEATFPRYSRSPVVHELLRVAVGVGEGWFPPEALHGRVEAFRSQFERFIPDFLEACRSEADPDALQRLQRMEECLVRLREGLDGFERFLTRPDVDELERSFLEVREACEPLVDEWEALQGRTQPRPAPCPRCAEVNPPGQRMCLRCNTQLPGVLQGPTHLFEIREGLEGTPLTFPNLARLEESVDAFRLGTFPREDLLETVAWFAVKVRAGYSQLTAQPTPVRAMPQHQEMEAATLDMLHGVESMESFFEGVGLEALLTGLEQVRLAAARLALVLGPPPPAP
ncbi:MAG: zinc ribbon domain-containing protein, partial [Candidatus Eremiobacterota bacterium]